MEPLRKISYNCKYEGYPGNSNVIFELEEMDGKTRMAFKHEVIADFSDDIPEFGRESCQGGWEYFINGSLRNLMIRKSLNK